MEKRNITAILFLLFFSVVSFSCKKKSNSESLSETLDRLERSMYITNEFGGYQKGELNVPQINGFEYEGRSNVVEYVKSEKTDEMVFRLNKDQEFEDFNSLKEYVLSNW